MREIEFECYYCGHKWTEIITYSVGYYKCSQCGDKRIIVKDKSEKIDTYADPNKKQDGS